MTCKQKTGLSNKGVNLFQDEARIMHGKFWEITAAKWGMDGE
ncbi:MAG TPA: hypothetical protein VN721_13555 [Flavipsychrobacter sp.]|nr:hypothetical protein [Flavipsychrobacter sp.]